MKKLLALILVLCFSLAATAAVADEFASYMDGHPAARAYDSTWVAEDGDWQLSIYGEDDGMRVYIVHKLGDNKQDIWEYAAALDADNKLTAVPLGVHYRQDIMTYDWDVTYYEDGDAEFILTENGMLLWNDWKEDAGKGLEFQKIGRFLHGRWMKDDMEVIFFEWYDGQYDIRLYQRGENGEILKDAILKADYEPETDTVTGTAEFEGEEPFTVTFSINEEGDVVWTENGESTPLEYSFLTD